MRSLVSDPWFLVPGFWSVVFWPETKDQKPRTKDQGPGTRDPNFIP